MKKQFELSKWSERINMTNRISSEYVKSRNIVKCIHEICEENNIAFQTFSDEWILQLYANNKTMLIYGYRFPNNGSANDRVCSDKAALSTVLQFNHIPCVPHVYFPNPASKSYAYDNGDWEIMIDILKKYGCLVCKNNMGTGGNIVYKVDNQKELEHAVFNVFSRGHALAISPWEKVQKEYRAVVVNQEIGLIYEKIRPFVVGDGKKTIRELAAEKAFDFSNYENDYGLDFVLPAGDKLNLTWKHNLRKGSTSHIIEEPSVVDAITNLALSCAIQLDLEFVSVDIIQTDNGYKVLEINPGIMLEHFSGESDEKYGIAKEIYRKAILRYLRLDDIKMQYVMKRTKSTRLILPILEEIAASKKAEIIQDTEERNFDVFVFKNGTRFVAKDYPFNINYSGSIALCSNKNACSSFLRRMGYKVPLERFYVKKEPIEVTLQAVEKDIIEDSFPFGFPMIVKPNGLSQGCGVQKVNNISECILAVKKVLSLKQKFFLLQEYCTGKEYRVVVLDGEIIQAYERVPFHIIGDGTHTIRELVEVKIGEFLEKKRDKIVDINDPRILRNIKAQGWTFETVLKNGTVCILQNIANLSLGGTPIDVTYTISDYYSQLCVKVAYDLNLKLCGIDIIANDISTDDPDYTIIEINSAPGLDNYLYEEDMQKQYVYDLYLKVFEYLESIN